MKALSPVLLVQAELFENSLGCWAAWRVPSFCVLLLGLSPLDRGAGQTTQRAPDGGLKAMRAITDCSCVELGRS